jgi:plasmid stabilization system protein ParE
VPYRLSALAEQDLEEIWLYVAEDAGPTTADRQIDAIVDRFDLLIEQPAIGRSRPEFGAGVRSFVVESYVIYPDQRWRWGFRACGRFVGRGIHRRCGSRVPVRLALRRNRQSELTWPRLCL